MTLIHTPRVIASLVKGLRQQSSSKNVGISAGNPHKYSARIGLFDIDYLGHMNNAAFLSHAEYARWEMTAANGLLTSMYKTNTNYMVSSVSCRYRAQLRPLLRKFQVQSMVSGMDDKHIWIYQTFRIPEEGNDRVRAQVLVKGVTVRGTGTVIDPREFLINDVGYDPELVDSLSRPSADTSMEDLISHFEELDASYRKAAALDDERLQK